MIWVILGFSLFRNWRLSDLSDDCGFEHRYHRYTSCSWYRVVLKRWHVPDVNMHYDHLESTTKEHEIFWLSAWKWLGGKVLNIHLAVHYASYYCGKFSELFAAIWLLYAEKWTWPSLKTYLTNTHLQHLSSLTRQRNLGEASCCTLRLTLHESVFAFEVIRLFVEFDRLFKRSSKPID